MEYRVYLGMYSVRTFSNDRGEVGFARWSKLEKQRPAGAQGAPCLIIPARTPGLIDLLN